MGQMALSTKVSPETYIKLDEAAAETGQSKAAIIEAALKQYLEAKGV